MDLENDRMSHPLSIWVPTSASYRNRENLCREVWLPEAEACGLSVTFYDEGETFPIYPSAPFRYKERQAIALGFNLSEKIQRMFAKALDAGCDYVLRSDTDTCLWPRRIKEAFEKEWHKHDYVGNCGFPPISPPFMFNYCSGMAYMLSRRAMSLVVDAKLFRWEDGDKQIDEWAEDRFVGRVMHENGIPFHLDSRIVWNHRWEENGEVPWLAWHDFGKKIGQLKGCPYLAKGEEDGEIY